MEIFKSYNELLAELETYRANIRRVNRAKAKLANSANINPPKITTPMYGERLRGGKVNITFKTYLIEDAKLNEELERYTELYRETKEDIKRVETILENLSKEGKTEYKVFYMKYKEGKKLTQIADELDMNYDYIKQIHAKTQKDMQKSSENSLKTH